ncbi:MAG: response regulator transcription factor [Saprospiraceae bacterium]|nr:response regulator transcription factor [Saprospiraceae bacterium]MBK8511052.1 response regulator transcription factor [Saprospiraceae bacterium]
MIESKKVQCLVVDDEPRAREVLRQYISQVPTLEMIGSCANALEALVFLHQHEVELMFLDIRMPQLNGNDFLKTLKKPPKTIITTAFQEYALEGYELDITDYLLKPIAFDRFLKAINKSFPTKEVIPTEFIREEVFKNEPFVYFRADRKMVKVMLADMLYIESMKDYIKVYTTTGLIVTRQSISSVEDMLPESKFIRVHRSFIVALHQVKTFTPETIGMGNKEIPIGKLYRNEVIKLLQLN